MDNSKLVLSLKELMIKLQCALILLLKLLEEQHSYVVENDVFKMEAIVEKIEKCNQEIASIELKRREITKGLLVDKPFGKLIQDLGDNELKDMLRNLRRIINDVKIQKETNDLLLKQGLSFTNRMLTILNPDRQMKTYDGYGKMRR